MVGAGFGGLGVAMRLAAAGLDVTVVDRGPTPGGRACRLQDQGFTWDMGPSLVTMPWVFEELFALLGRDFHDEVDLVELDPLYRIDWPHDGTRIDFRRGVREMQDEIRPLSGSDAARYPDFLEASRLIHEEAVLAAGRRAFEGPAPFARLLPTMLRLDAARNLSGFCRKFFSEEHVFQAMSFHSLYIGGDPFRVPAVYAALAYLQVADGVWYAMGGMYSIVQAMVRAIEDAGGRVRCSADVDEILARNGRAVGVRLADGEVIPADIVISDADPVRTRARLLRGAPDSIPWRFRGPRNGMSCFLLYLGTDRQWPELLHHTLVVGDGYRRFLDDVTHRRVLPQDLSLYLHVPARTDASMAPPGCDSLAVLLPVPNLASGDDWDSIGDAWRDKVLRYLEEDAGLGGLRSSITVEHRMTPLDFQSRYDADEGTAFSTEPLLTRSAYFRQPNRDRTVRGLYHVGAGAHPGAGVPGVLLGAEVAAGLVARDIGVLA
ncbi:MAG: phytoene desaturase family protein [Actinomycetota bacterium]|nr:phytoene desaturase family protein [Actinomycetota bacterium]